MSVIFVFGSKQGVKGAMTILTESEYVDRLLLVPRLEDVARTMTSQEASVVQRFYHIILRPSDFVINPEVPHPNDSHDLARVETSGGRDRRGSHLTE